MGRAVVIEERIQSKLKTLITSSQVHLGLLVGQLASSKDYVSLFVRTPALQEVASDDEQRCEVNNLNAFEDWWVKEHARQVSALLCGGLSIVGVAVCCSTEQFKEHQLKCRQWLNDVTPSPSPGSSILLHCPTNSKKFTCQTIDLSDAQATFRPADLKFQSHVDHWTRLESVLALQWMSYVPTDQTSHMTSPGSILKPLLEQLSSAMLVVRGQPAMQGSDMLVKTKKPSPSQAIQMEWLSQLYTSESGLPQMLPPGTRKVCVDGYLSLIAYVPPKASLDDARAISS